MSSEKKLVGVVCDKYKSIRYQNRIKKDGYTIKQIMLGKDVDTIQVEIETSKIKGFGELIKSLEEKYSKRNRIR